MSSGALELLKWLALVLMTGDHVNLALFERSMPVLSEIARVVFPIFAVVMAYNLARPGARIERTFWRLLVVAAISQVPHVVIMGEGLPLNVLFTFAAAVAAIVCWRRGWLPAAVAVFWFSGFFCDYQWPGIALVLAGYWHFRTLQGWAAIAVAACTAALVFSNGNFYAMAALPVILLANAGEWPIPRAHSAFWVYYPAHLAVLAIWVLGAG